jgi:hypothetical protein
VREGGQLLFPDKYYAEITPILTELGVPRATVPVMAQDVTPASVAGVQEIARQEDFEVAIGVLMPQVVEWAGREPSQVTVYISEIFDHYAWVDRNGWSIVVKPALPEPYPSFNIVQVAHNLAHCARMDVARATYLANGLDFYKREGRRHFRVDMPLAEDVVNEGFAIAGAHIFAPEYYGRNSPAPWYDSRVTALLKRFVALREAVGDHRVIFMGDRAGFPAETWWELPSELVFAGHYIGLLLVNQAFHEASVSWSELLEKPAGEIINLAFTRLRRPRETV